MIKGFKEFITKGNAMDLAVGVVIGAAFTAIVNALVKGIIDPLIGLVLPGSVKNLSEKVVTISGADFLWGAVVSEAITFFVTAAAIYFVFVAPLNHLRERRESGQEGDIEPSNEEKIVALLEQIAAKN